MIQATGAEGRLVDAPAVAPPDARPWHLWHLSGAALAPAFDIMQACIILRCIMLFVDRFEELARLDRLAASGSQGLRGRCQDRSPGNFDEPSSRPADRHRAGAQGTAVRRMERTAFDDAALERAVRRLAAKPLPPVAEAEREIVRGRFLPECETAPELADNSGAVLVTTAADFL